ncbi:MAG TPA: hypothetical protein ENI42_02520, partial [Thermoplasmatales archaeon]|nr:hypothetical protein [Thermoplasmatales archaeon]
MGNKNSDSTKKILNAVAIVFILASSLYALINIPVSTGSYTYELKTFSSYEDLLQFIKNTYGNHNTYYCGERYYGPNIVFTKNSVSDGATLETSTTGSIDFSKTNIQVEGVDEPDIVKTDGTYIYMIANQSIYIIK